MRSQPLPGEASRRRAEEQFKTTKKIDYQPHTSTAARRAEAERTGYARFGWPRKQPTRILQIETR